MCLECEFYLLVTLGTSEPICGWTVSSVLSILFLDNAGPPYCANIQLISVSEAAALPIIVMVCKADLYS